MEGVEQLRDDAGSLFDAWNWRWIPGNSPRHEGEAVSAEAALAKLGRTGAVRRVPVGVIGPSDASDAQAATAEALGEALAELGLTVICGGRTGVMAAVAKGARDAGGLTVGLLPGSDWREANVDISLPIATGLGEARNMIIAKSCAVLIAVGGSYGTLSEVAFGLHFGKLVIGLEGADPVPGTVLCENVADAVSRLSVHLLGPAAATKPDSM